MTLQLDSKDTVFESLMSIVNCGLLERCVFNMKGIALK